MNFLAHAHLSGNKERILAGNLMGDAVKGKSWMAFAPGIRDGILLHRRIDDFTDKHPLVRDSKAVVRPYFGLYSGIVTDLYFDHFLAVGWSGYSDSNLLDFTHHVYWILARHFSLLPPKVRRILPFMVAQNWLYGYASKVDLERIFYNMDRRTNFRSGMKRAVPVLEKHYGTLKENFREFYPQLEKQAKGFIHNLYPQNTNF